MEGLNHRRYLALGWPKFSYDINVKVERGDMRINIVGAGPAVAGQNPGQGAQERGGYLIIGSAADQNLR